MIKIVRAGFGIAGIILTIIIFFFIKITAVVMSTATAAATVVSILGEKERVMCNGLSYQL